MEVYNSPAISTRPDPSNTDSNPFAMTSEGIGLGITVAGVLPFVLVVRTIVIWLFKWRERRQRKRRGTNIARDGRVKRQDEETVGFGMKAELSARQARFEMEAEERRFEISGVDARVEMPVSEVSSGKKGKCSTQELRGHEVAQELRGDEHSDGTAGRPVYKQPEVLIESRPGADYFGKSSRAHFIGFRSNPSKGFTPSRYLCTCMNFANAGVLMQLDFSFNEQLYEKKSLIFVDCNLSATSLHPLVSK